MKPLDAVRRRARAWLGRRQWHEIGGVRIELPAEHRLPEYQAAHPLYDRFLEHLAAQLGRGDAVVDIGANVGDSAAALLAGCAELEILAIEADAGFHAVLERNVQRLQWRYAQAQVRTLRALVGGGSAPMRLVGEGGTRRAVPDGDAASTPSVARGRSGESLLAQRLDALLAREGDAFVERLRLVKCDVDGGDADAIASGLAVIQRRLPMLFVECDARDAGQQRAFAVLLARLHEAGYVRGFVFDNFGRVLDEAATPVALERYLAAPLAPRSTRRFDYVDLLLTTARDAPLAAAAVSRHRRAALRAGRDAGTAPAPARGTP